MEKVFESYSIDSLRPEIREIHSDAMILAERLNDVLADRLYPVSKIILAGIILAEELGYHPANVARICDRIMQSRAIAKNQNLL